MKTRLSAIIMMVALLAGCATPASGPRAPATEGTVMPAATAVPPTEVRTAIPTDTPTVIPTATCTPEPTSTPTPTLIPPSPTPTLDPGGDPDGDGYSSYAEQIWGEDPLAFTSFDELAYHPGTIYARMRVSQPFALEDMNGLLYQVVRPISIEDKGTPGNPSDDHLVFDVVLFPYATHPSISTQVSRFPIDPNTYPAEVRQYLESTQVSKITPEMRETLLQVVEGARSDAEAINRILRWNQDNLTVMEPAKGFFYFYEIVSIKAGDMFDARQTWYSTSRATLLAAELRAIGIPTRIVFGVYTTDQTNQTNGLYDHPQNMVFLRNQWVRLDYNMGLNYRGELRDPYSYGYLAFTDQYRDTSEADWTAYISVADYWQGGDNYLERWWQLHKPLEFREN